MDIPAVEWLAVLKSIDMLLSGSFSWFSSRGIWILFLTMRLCSPKLFIDLLGGFTDVKRLTSGADDTVDYAG